MNAAFSLWKLGTRACMVAKFFANSGIHFLLQFQACHYALDKACKPSFHGVMRYVSPVFKLLLCCTLYLWQFTSYVSLHVAIFYFRDLCLLPQKNCLMSSNWLFFVIAHLHNWPSKSGHAHTMIFFYFCSYAWECCCLQCVCINFSPEKEQSETSFNFFPTYWPIQAGHQTNIILINYNFCYDLTRV